MKIAICVQKLTDGGAERVAALWATGFYERGHTVGVFISDNNSPITYRLPEGITIKTTNYHHKNKICRFIGNAMSLRNALKSFNPDVIIDVMPCLVRRVAMIGVGGKKISTEHNSFERPANAIVKHNKVNKIYLNHFYDHVTVLTQADKDVIGNQLKNVTVLPNPLALTPAKEMPCKEKKILATGRLDAWHYKGFDILIKAWAKIVDKADGWKLQIAGSSKGEGIAYLQKLCNDFNISNTVEFVGYQSDILPFYKNASIFVLSSRYEGFGLVLIEAMSQGCACVACDYKGRQKEIITSEKQGVICEPENIKELANAILSLINDEQKRNFIGENAINRSMDFRLDNIMNRWEEIIRKIK